MSLLKPNLFILNKIQSFMRKASTLYSFDYQPILRVKRGRFTHK